MARATQTIKTNTRTTAKIKSSSTGDRIKCNVCGGSGYHKKPTRKK